MGIILPVVSGDIILPFGSGGKTTGRMIPILTNERMISPLTTGRMIPPLPN
jgi:hypothetical protein